VLDDCSTDNSREVVTTFGSSVNWVGGTRNLRAGGNRNRILETHTTECIIHFLDADIRLETSDVPAKARLMMRDHRTAFVGGLVKDLNGRQSPWNYGPDSVALYTTLTGLMQLLFSNVQAPRPLWRSMVRALTRRARSEWPDPAAPPERRAVYWPVEGNLLIRRSVLEKLGGFDASISEYDIIPPARKAYEAGLVSYFDPSIVVTHLAVDVRHYNRTIALYKELRLLIKRYGGWRQFLRPYGRFKPRYNQ
jgi:GT2 family glycosyltransferase